MIVEVTLTCIYVTLHVQAKTHGQHTQKVIHLKKKKRKCIHHIMQSLVKLLKIIIQLYTYVYI